MLNKKLEQIGKPLLDKLSLLRASSVYGRDPIFEEMGKGALIESCFRMMSF